MGLAYLNDLPPLIIRREVRSPYSSVAEYHCRENRDELQELFGPRSVLVVNVVPSEQVWPSDVSTCPLM